MWLRFVLSSWLVDGAAAAPEITLTLTYVYVLSNYMAEVSARAVISIMNLN